MFESGVHLHLSQHANCSVDQSSITCRNVATLLFNVLFILSDGIQGKDSQLPWFCSHEATAYIQTNSMLSDC